MNDRQILSVHFRKQQKPQLEPDAPVEHEWIASFFDPEGCDHNGAGDSPASALLRAVGHWARRERTK